MRIISALICYLFYSFSYSQSDITVNVLARVNPKYQDVLAFKVTIDREEAGVIKGNERLICKIPSTSRVTVNVAGSFGIGSFVIDANSSDNTVFRDFGAKGLINDFSRWRLGDTTLISELKNTEIRTIVVGKRNDGKYYRVDEATKSVAGQGTCFLISSNGYLITNYHCVENAKEITVKGIDGDFTTKYGASVVGSDPSNDLALLKIGNKNVKFNTPPFALRTSGVAQAEKAYALGFPAADAMGDEVKITEGIISAKSGVGNDISKFQISAAVNHGNSGGPLIDEQGNLIGVIFAKSTIAESAGYAVKASYLETFLKNVDGFEIPALTNTLKDKPLTDKVAELKNFIFIVETN